MLCTVTICTTGGSYFQDCLQFFIYFIFNTQTLWNLVVKSELIVIPDLLRWHFNTETSVVNASGLLFRLTIHKMDQQERDIQAQSW